MISRLSRLATPMIFALATTFAMLFTMSLVLAHAPLGVTSAAAHAGDVATPFPIVAAPTAQLPPSSTPVPDPLGDPDGFVDTLRKLRASGGLWVAIGVAVVTIAGGLARRWKPPADAPPLDPRSWQGRRLAIAGAAVMLGGAMADFAAGQIGWVAVLTIVAGAGALLWRAIRPPSPDPRTVAVLSEDTAAEVRDSLQLQGSGVRLVDISAATPSARVAASKALTMLVLIAVLATGCATTRSAATAGSTAGLDCMTPQVQVTVQETGALAKAFVLSAISGTGEVDTAALRAAAAGLKTEGMRCSLIAAIAALVSVAGEDTADAGPRPLLSSSPVPSDKLRTAARQIAELEWGIKGPVVVEGGVL